MAFTEAIRKATPNVAPECVRTSRPCDDLDAADRTSIPPRPIGITDDSRSWRRGLTRAVVPSTATNYVAAGFASQRKMNHGIESHGIFPGVGTRCIQQLFCGGVNRHVLVHEFGVDSNKLPEVQAAPNDKISACTNKLAQITLWNSEAATNVEEI